MRLFSQSLIPCLLSLLFIAVPVSVHCQEAPEGFFDDDELETLQVTENKPEITESSAPAVQESSSHHSAGLHVGAGPGFSTGIDYAVMVSAEYRYLLLSEHLAVGANLGLMHLGSTWFNANSFMGQAAAEYFVLTGKWRPFGGVGIGGVAGDIDAFLLSPALGTQFALSDRIHLEAAFRFPILIGTAGGEIATMTFGVGGHFRF